VAAGPLHGRRRVRSSKRRLEGPQPVVGPQSSKNQVPVRGRGGGRGRSSEPPRRQRAGPAGCARTGSSSRLRPSKVADPAAAEAAPSPRTSGAGRPPTRAGWAESRTGRAATAGCVSALARADQVRTAGPGSGQRDRVRVGPHEPQASTGAGPVELAAHQVSHSADYVVATPVLLAPLAPAYLRATCQAAAIRKRRTRLLSAGQRRRRGASLLPRRRRDRVRRPRGIARRGHRPPSAEDTTRPVPPIPPNTVTALRHPWHRESEQHQRANMAAIIGGPAATT